MEALRAGPSAGRRSGSTGRRRRRSRPRRPSRWWWSCRGCRPRPRGGGRGGRSARAPGAWRSARRALRRQALGRHRLRVVPRHGVAHDHQVGRRFEVGRVEADERIGCRRARAVCSSAGRAACRSRARGGPCSWSRQASGAMPVPPMAISGCRAAVPLGGEFFTRSDVWTGVGSTGFARPPAPSRFRPESVLAPHRSTAPDGARDTPGGPSDHETSPVRCHSDTSPRRRASLAGGRRRRRSARRDRRARPRQGGGPGRRDVEAVFEIANDGDQPLEITEVRPSCGCTVAEFDKVIEPGEHRHGHGARRHHQHRRPERQGGDGVHQRPGEPADPAHRQVRGQAVPGHEPGLRPLHHLRPRGPGPDVQSQLLVAPDFQGLEITRRREPAALRQGELPRGAGHRARRDVRRASSGAST